MKKLKVKVNWIIENEEESCITGPHRVRNGKMAIIYLPKGYFAMCEEHAKEAGLEE